MFRMFIIWICLGWIAIISAQSFINNFEVSYPELVHQTKSFEVSIITSNEIINANRLDLYIITQHGIVPDVVLLQTENQISEIEFFRSPSEGFNDNTFMCSINLTQFDSLGASSFFQILLKFNSGFIEYAEIDFYGEFRKDNMILCYLNNDDERLSSDYPHYHRLKINFYTSTSTGEKALLFQPKSEFRVAPYFNIENNLLADFWLNLNHKDFTFLEIKNKHTDLTEYRLSTNEFQILIPESDFYREKKVIPLFIPQNSWVHIAVLFSYDKNEIEFNCNKKQIAVFELSNSLSPSEIEFLFINNSEGKFELDQFRILDFNESVDASFENSNFTNFISQKSFIKHQFSFNKTTLLELFRNEFIIYSNVALVPSDAPIFSRAPELNLQILNNYYELTWIGGDFVNAKSYVLEQAEGDQAYKEIFSDDADNFVEKTYSFLHERKSKTGVVYFRVKQINKDGSVVHSSQVKIGEGELEEFIIDQNYPNPFNPKTQISIEVLISSDFEIVVYNLEGGRISVLHDGFLPAGEYQFIFDGSDLPSGIYLYKASSQNFSQTKKMILAK